MKNRLMVVLIFSVLLLACSMSSLQETPPEWANFFTADQYDTFIELVHTHFDEQDLEVTIEDGTVIVLNDENDSRFGLRNLAQICYQSEQEEWAGIITDHFTEVRAIEDEKRILVENMDDFTQISDFLAVRLWHTETFEAIGRENAIYREDLEGTASILVFDLPNSIKQVLPSEASPWNKTDEELFKIALRNVENNTQLDSWEQDLGDGVQVIVFAGDSFYVASHVLLLDKFPQCIGDYGSLIGIPHRHVMVCYPIKDSDVIKAINLLIPIVADLYSEGPGSVSPNLYWYHDDEFINLPYTLTEDTFDFVPPEEFIELLGQIVE